ncbi:glycosyltransferase family 4 protein [Candidatus Dependentiae bacterium]|nr:glycosyltransferase family 4 protein [Candidatus Dependentiae bacterium]
MNNKKVCMIVNEYYPKDFRVRREAEALYEKGFEVDVICLKKDREKYFEKWNNITIFRMPVKRRRGSPLIVYLTEYLMFFLFSLVTLNILYLKKYYTYVHISNPPDFLVFVGIIQKILGEKIILDIHDRIPLLYSTRFNCDTESRMIHLLKFVEKISAKYATGIITAVDVYKNYFLKISGHQKIETVLNTADEKYFYPRIKIMYESKKKLKLFHHGTLVKRYGLDVLILAVKEVISKGYDCELTIYGEGNYYDELQKIVIDKKLKNRVFFKGFLLIDYLPEKIAESDLCIVPNRQGVFMNTILPTKLLEYIVMEKPVITSRTEGITVYFSDKELTFFEPENINELSEKIIEFINNQDKFYAKVNFAKQKYELIKWEIQKDKLLNFYEKII